MKRYFALLVIATCLSACVSQPPKSLDQKLSDSVSEADRREVLRLACLNEAEVVNGKSYPFGAPSRGHSAPRIPGDVYQAKNLCRKMELKESEQGSVEARQENGVSLRKECNAILGRYAQKYPSDTGHVLTMKKICHEMTN